MAGRLIDADKLMEKLSRMIDYCNKDPKVNGLTALFQVGDAIMDSPTVDAVEVVHGRWIPVIDEPSQVLKMPMLVGYKCSVCGRYEEQEEPYCPNCGAKMDGGRTDGN